MALHIQLRHGTASAWTSANPTLSQGEPGVETDTGQIKIGDGVTAWNSLAYQSSTGPTQTSPYRSLGDGSDGNVTISSGTTNLSRDMFYNNLTMSGTGVLNTNGYKVFIKGVLDLTSAAVGAIQWNGLSGGNASGATGGTAPGAQLGGTLGAIATSTAGSTATTGNGTSAGAAPAFPGGVGGNGGNGGRGGVGTSGSPAAGSSGRAASYTTSFRRFESNLIFGTTLVQGGGGGAGGDSGAGDGVNNGAGGGGGANGGGVVALYVNTILTGSSTPSGVIQANGGMGGNGASTAVGVTGGGGGGGGGAGGWVYICYNQKYGPVITNLIQANGGMGGNGGSGFGSGASGADGGYSGTGGRITLRQIPTSFGTELIAPTSTVLVPEILGSVSFNIQLSGSNGGFGGYCQMNL